MEIKEIISWVAMCLPIVSFIVCFVILFIKKIKQPNKSKMEAVQEALKEASEHNSQLYQLLNVIVPTAVQNAEKCGLPNGTTKKLVCVSEIMQECVRNNIAYDKYANDINEMVENLISFSKSVNVKK